MPTQPQKYLVATKGEPLATGINHIAPNPNKGKKKKVKKIKPPISSSDTYETQVKWERGEPARQKKISTYVDQKDWSGLEDFVKKLCLIKKSLVKKTMLFAQEKLENNSECPPIIMDMIKSTLPKPKKS